MIPGPFAYHRPASVKEAVSLLVSLGEDARAIAGGHSLIPMMKLRLASPAHLIDLAGVADLKGIHEDGRDVVIGAMTTQHEVIGSELLANKVPILRETSFLIADPQVRNMGTIGGNLAHGDAANDHPALMLALRATVIATGQGGKRPIPIDEFFLGLFATALQQDEILTEIQIPVPAKGTGSAYHKLERKVGDYATAGAAVQLTINDKGICTDIGIGLTNVSATPMRASRSEQLILNNQVTEENISAAAQLAAEDCSPSADLRGSEEYKRAMVAVLVKRMIRKAVERTK